MSQTCLGMFFPGAIGEVCRRIKLAQGWGKEIWEGPHPPKHTLQLPPLSLQPQKGKNQPRFGAVMYMPGRMCSSQGRILQHLQLERRLLPKTTAASVHPECRWRAEWSALLHLSLGLPLALKVYPTLGPGWGPVRSRRK